MTVCEIPAVAYDYCSQQCTWCMVFFKAAISCCMEERCSSCSLAVASLFSKWVCFSWNVASSASSEAIYKLYDTFCISEVKWNFGHIAFYIHAIRFSCDCHSGTGFCRIFATWKCTGVLYYLIINWLWTRWYKRWVILCNHSLSSAKNAMQVFTLGILSGVAKILQNHL